MFSMPVFLIFFPEIFLVFSTFILFLFCCLYQKASKAVLFNDLLVWFSIPLLFFSIFLLKNIDCLNCISFNANFQLSIQGTWLKIFVFSMIIIFQLLSLKFFQFEKFQLFEFSFLILFSLLGICFLISSNNFFTFYLALELQSFCFYILSAMRRYSNLSVEAALKYFILGAFSSSVFLFGSSLIYGALGTLNFSDIQVLLSSYHSFYETDKLVVVGSLFILVGFLFKIGSVPFHFWIADVYEGSPLITTSFFAIVPKISFSFVLFFIYSFTFSALSYLLVDILMFSALSSISLGILYALYQTKIKRLIAYSAITHVGYILFALFQGSVEGFQALFIYFFIYIMTSFNLFCLLLIFRQSKTFYKLRKLVDFSFLLKSNYILSVMFVFILLSLAGIPPLAGFFGKFMVFLSVIQFNNYFVLFFLVLCTAASAIYYLS